MSTVATKLGSRGLDIIKSREQLRLKAYKPTTNDVYTIGYGHTKGVIKGQIITEAKAEEFLMDDIQEAVNSVHLLHKKLSSKGLKLTQSMIDTLISLVFNVGPSCISSGNTIGAALIKGDYYTACGGFFLWRKQTNKITGVLENVLGLARRRIEEMQLFIEDGIPK